MRLSFRAHIRGWGIVVVCALLIGCPSWRVEENGHSENGQAETDGPRGQTAPVGREDKKSDIEALQHLFGEGYEIESLAEIPFDHEADSARIRAFAAEYGAGSFEEMRQRYGEASVDPGAITGSVRDETRGVSIEFTDGSEYLSVLVRGLEANSEQRFQANLEFFVGTGVLASFGGTLPEVPHVRNMWFYPDGKPEVLFYGVQAPRRYLVRAHLSDSGQLLGCYKITEKE